jgi:type IV pilus assembly protein PilA
MKNLVRPLRSQAGFSLIELMIVVAIIGILATIAVPNFQKFQSKSRMTEGKGYLAAIYSGENSFYAEWNQFADCLEGVGVIAATGPSALVFQGAGVYRAGFTTGGTIKPPAAVFAAACAVGSAVPASAAGGVTIPATVPAGAVMAAGGQTFVAGASGQIGGTASDEWTLSSANLLTWTQSGL